MDHLVALTAEAAAAEAAAAEAAAAEAVSCCRVIGVLRTPSTKTSDHEAARDARSILFCSYSFGRHIVSALAHNRPSLRARQHQGGVLQCHKRAQLARNAARAFCVF